MDGRSAEICRRVGERIREERMKKNLSQDELASMADLGRDQLCNIELGKAGMRMTTFARLVEALQVSADSLLLVDTPAGRHFYQEKFAEIVADCSPEEIEALLAAVKDIKGVIRRNSE